MADYEWPIDDDLGPEDLEPVPIDDEQDGILAELDELAEYELGGEG